MHKITRKEEFDAGHRVLGHEGKCRHIHGHRYVVELTVEAPGTDSVGRVIDFSVVKEILKGWIDENWDHNYIANADDPLLTSPLYMDAHGLMGDVDLFDGKQPYIMPDHLPNPTAENMARHLLEVMQTKFKSPLQVTHVRLYETPNCWADAHI